MQVWRYLRVWVGLPRVFGLGVAENRSFMNEPMRDAMSDSWMG
jgi:hypothetical protein